MKIRLCQKECDNGEVTCKNCTYYEVGDKSIGLNSGCAHPILYDENEDLIEEVNDLIIECMNNPRHCILLVQKNHQACIHEQRGEQHV